MENNNPWIKALSLQKDWLYEKLASPEEGWNIVHEDHRIDVPLNELDLLAYSLLQKTISQKKRVALALPRIKIGVSLSIIAYLVVNRFIKQQNHPLQNFIPLSLNNGQNIVVATRNRKLRDFFMESFLRFANTDFPFTQFPIYRLNRLGNIIPLFGKQDSPTQLHLDPVNFYHFDDIAEIPNKLMGSCVIGELTETDSKYLAERLCAFIDSIKSDSSFILFNEFSQNTLSVLKNNNFEIIAITNKDMEYLSSSIKNTNLPSLGSSLIGCPTDVELDIEIVEDDIASLKLSRIVRMLSKLNKRLGNEKPLFLLKAWNIFYNLKDLAVSLEKLEEQRKQDIRLRSLKFDLDQIFNTPLSKLDPNIQDVFNPIWSTLGVEFKDLYNHLKTSCKKADKLKEILRKIDPNEKTTIVFNSQLELQTFEESILLEDGWAQNDSNIKVSSLDELLIASEVCDNVVLMGVWRKATQAKILALLPKKIKLICYTTELFSLSKNVKDMNTYYVPDLQSATIAALNKMGFNLTSNTTQNGSFIKPNQESQLLIEHSKDLSPKDPEMIQEEDESLDWLDGEQNTLESLEVESLEQKLQSGDEEIAVMQLTLSDGRAIFVPINKEVLAYSEDLGTIESKLPLSLSTGDSILLYSAEDNQEMFKTILDRTEELFHTDPRIINIWKSSLKELREWYDINNPNSLRAYMHDLQDLGFNKSNITAKNWLKGLTMAPNESDDIERLLVMIKHKNAKTISKLIATEIDKVRIFHRVLGRRVHVRLSHSLNESSYEEPKDAIDREIDEILESADIVTISELNPAVTYVSKSEVKTVVFG